MLETILKGRMMMIPLMTCSVLALAVFLDRMWAFYRNSKVDTRALRSQLMRLLRRGHVKDAALLCVNTPGQSWGGGMMTNKAVELRAAYDPEAENPHTIFGAISSYVKRK